MKYKARKSPDTKPKDDNMNIQKHYSSTKFKKCEPFDKCIGEEKMQLVSTELHQDEHAEERLLPSISCSQCSTKFGCQQTMLQHIRQHHVIKHSSNLQSHIRKLRQRFPCTECDQKFSFKSQLRVHSLIHTGKKPFVCEQCGKAFKRLQQCKVHKELVHSDKKIQCRECEKHFGTASNLLRHRLAFHFNIKRWICGFCSHTYAHSQDLRRHLKKVHQFELRAILYKSKKTHGEVYIIPELNTVDILAEMKQKIETTYKEETEKWKELSASCGERHDVDEFKKAPLFSASGSSKEASASVASYAIQAAQFRVCGYCKRSIQNLEQAFKCGICGLDICCLSHQNSHNNELHGVFQCFTCNLKFLSKELCLSHIKKSHLFSQPLRVPDLQSNNCNFSSSSGISIIPNVHQVGTMYVVPQQNPIIQLTAVQNVQNSDIGNQKLCVNPAVYLQNKDFYVKLLNVSAVTGEKIGPKLVLVNSAYDPKLISVAPIKPGVHCNFLPFSIISENKVPSANLSENECSENATKQAPISFINDSQLLSNNVDNGTKLMTISTQHFNPAKEPSQETVNFFPVKELLPMHGMSLSEKKLLPMHGMSLPEKKLLPIKDNTNKIMLSTNSVNELPSVNFIKGNKMTTNPPNEKLTLISAISCCKKNKISSTSVTSTTFDLNMAKEEKPPSRNPDSQMDLIKNTSNLLFTSNAGVQTFKPAECVSVIGSERLEAKDQSTQILIQPSVNQQKVKHPIQSARDSEGEKIGNIVSLPALCCSNVIQANAEQRILTGDCSQLVNKQLNMNTFPKESTSAVYTTQSFQTLSNLNHAFQDGMLKKFAAPTIIQHKQLASGSSLPNFPLFVSNQIFNTVFDIGNQMVPGPLFTSLGISFKDEDILIDHHRTQPSGSKDCNEHMLNQGNFKTTPRTISASENVVDVPKTGEPSNTGLETSETLVNSSSLSRNLCHHPEDLSYECAICNKAFLNQTQFERHKRTHAEKQHRCRICGKGFVEKFNLKTHMLMHTQARPHQCTKCDKKFRYFRDLKDHLRSHDGILAFECEHCGKKFLRQKDLVRHVKEQHSSIIYKCRECECEFKRKFYLDKVHMKTHAPKTSAKKNFLNCSQCEKAFKPNPELESHKYPADLSPFACSVCGKAFKKKGTLASHLRRGKKDSSSGF